MKQNSFKTMMTDTVENDEHAKKKIESLLIQVF